MKKSTTKVPEFKIATVAPIKGYKALIDAGCLHVEIIEDNSEYLHVKLGITRERAKELFSIGKDAYNKSKGVAEALAKISLQCKHANELAYLCFDLGTQIDTSRNTGPTNIGSIMQHIMQDIRKRRQQDEGAE